MSMLLPELESMDCKPAPSDSKICLPLARYRLRYEADLTIHMTNFPGSAWRGALGHTLKQICCTTHLPVCSSCPKYRHCAYTEIFETPPPPGAAKMRKYLQAPHPFVLEHRVVAGNLPAADRRCDLILTLIGRGVRHLPLFITALKQAAQSPSGVSGNCMRLWRIERETQVGGEQWVAIDPHEIDAVATTTELAAPPVLLTAVIRLLTPLRIKKDGRHVAPAAFRFSDLFSNVLRRLSMLTYFHTSTPLDLDFRELIEASRTIRVETALGWRDLSRYSSRQKTAMRMGGLVGQIQIQNQPLAPFWPYLWLGQWVHAGAAATMGLGQYTICAGLQVTKKHSRWSKER